MRISDWSSDVCSSDLPLGEMFLLRRSVKVRHMHQRRRLFLDRADQMRMVMTKDIDRDAAGEIEEAPAILADQMAALASHRAHVAPWVDGHKRRNGHGEIGRANV